jgi:hypothetical protein
MKECVSNQRTVRETLLWQLRNQAHEKLECIARRRDDGRVQVSIGKEGMHEDSDTFADIPTAVRWAFDQRRGLVSVGWAVVV